jgi:hypothetical protein
MGDWSEQDPHSHINRVTRFVKQIHNNRDHAAKVR